jgi:hypothetical protein
MMTGNQDNPPCILSVSYSRTQHTLAWTHVMKPHAILSNHTMFLLMISLLMSLSCATASTQRPTTVGPACSISWDKTNDPKVTRYQLTVINQENPAEKTLLIIPAETTKLPCKDAGANHEGLWGVTVQSCYDTFTCSFPTDIVRMRIALE